MKTKTVSKDWSSSKRLVDSYLQSFEEVYAGGAFDGVGRVLVSGAGTAEELGALLLISRGHGADYSIDGVELQRHLAPRVMSWLDDKFPGHNVNLLVGDVLNLSAIRRARNLAPWDLIVDRQSGPLAQLSGENTGADAIKLLRIYAENLTEGGRLVVTKNFNMQEPNPQVESFLASSGSPFERVTETSSGDKTASVVYKKKPAC